MVQSSAILRPVFVGLPCKTVVFVGQARALPPSSGGSGSGHSASGGSDGSGDDPKWSPKPKDYADFVKLFSGKIRSQVSGFVGIDREDIDDITQDIMMQFIAGDYLNIYSPEKQSQYAEARYQTQLALFKSGELEYAPERFSGKFSSFVFEFTKRRLMGIRDKTNRRVSTMRSLDTFVEENEESGESSALVFFGTTDEQFLNVEVRQLLQQAYSHLAEITTPTATRNFPELFTRAISDAFENPEGFDRAAYAASKGITISAVSMQIRELKLHLEQSGFYKDLKQMVIARGRTSASR